MDQARLFIIGAGGFLGGHAARAAKDSFEVFTGGRNAATGADSVQIDITDASSVDAGFRQVQPDAVLLLACLLYTSDAADE